MAYCNPTGLPSVTDIIAPYIDTEWFTQESKERGSAVHAACHAHIMGCYVLPLPEAWRGYFDSFRRWCDLVKPVVTIAEVRLIDKARGFCGQPDFVGSIAGREGAGLIDWKTSLAPASWHRLQVAAYRHLAAINGAQNQWGGDLRLKADGSLPLFDDCPDINEDLNLFMGALRLYQFFK